MTNKKGRETIVLNSAIEKLSKDSIGQTLNMEEAVSLYKNSFNMLPEHLVVWVNSWLNDRYEGTETYAGGVRYSSKNGGRKVSKRNPRNL